MRPTKTCVKCLHCSQDTYFPVCLAAEKAARYEPVYGSRVNGFYELCVDEYPERGDCLKWEPIPSPSTFKDRLARLIGWHPWLWGRRKGL